MPHVYSTLSANMNYNVYYTPTVPKGQEARRIEKTIAIKGGSGVAPLGKNGRGGETLFGILTTISEEELELLEKDEVFQTHVNNGFISVSRKKLDPEVVIADMELRDDSSPLMPEDNTPGDVNNGTSFDGDVKINKKQRIGKVMNNIQ